MEDKKQMIIDTLKQIKEVSVRLAKKPLTEEFIRGFVMGAETSLNIRIGSHNYNEIIEEVLK